LDSDKTQPPSKSVLSEETPAYSLAVLNCFSVIPWVSAFFSTSAAFLGPSADSRGRGKTGGVMICADEHEVWETADEMLGERLVTQENGPKGKMISCLYVEEGTSIEADFYLSFVLDRCSERIMIVASAAGGMDIEEVAKNSPDAIVNISVEPAVGVQKFQAREIAFALGVRFCYQRPDFFFASKENILPQR
jgi:hypothetical protein